MLNRNLHVENPTGPCDVKHRRLRVSAPSGGLEGYMGEAQYMGSRDEDVAVRLDFLSFGTVYPTM